MVKELGGSIPVILPCPVARMKMSLGIMEENVPEIDLRLVISFIY